jgi:hypothetical protein
MNDPSRRVVVDRIEFLEVFHWWRIVQAVPMAMQPPKLIIGLLMVAALMSIGRIWDSAAGPRITPAALLGDPVTDEEIEAYHDALRAAATRYAPEAVSTNPNETALPDAPVVLQRIAAGYARQRSAAAAPAQDPGPEALRAQAAEAHAAYLATMAELERLRPRGLFESALGFTVDRFNTCIRATLTLRPREAVHAVKEMVWIMPRALWAHDRVFTLVYGLLAAVIVALGGGALSRMTACEFAGQERLRVREAVDFALGNAFQLILSLLLPLLIAAGLALLLAAAGAVLMWGWLDLIGGPLYGFALIIGLLIAFLLAGYFAAAGLLVPAVACERCDAGEALQRGYSYAVHRFLHLVWYFAVAMAALALGYVILSVLAALALRVTAGSVGALSTHPGVEVAGQVGLLRLSGAESGPSLAIGHDRLAAWFIAFWEMLARSLVASYVFTCGFSALTIVYLLLRRVCDGQELTEIWRPEAGIIPAPAGAVSAGSHSAAESHTGSADAGHEA